MAKTWKVNPKWGAWIVSGGKDGEEPPEDAKKLYDLHNQFKAEVDENKRIEIEKEIRGALAGFDMPTFVTRVAPRADGLRITLAGRNLAVWTDYTGIDPELNSGGSSTNFGTQDFLTQPPLRYWTARLTFNF